MKKESMHGSRQPENAKSSKNGADFNVRQNDRKAQVIPAMTPRKGKK